ncbi:response regulator of citrate/malate metabolism [Mycetocola sp. BIGb0189]|uniref:response regulator n=1 Tax=Mycetocola sp. BIGb0189 TaxID=2940604 RepID=UPI002168FA7F|nr:response regulator [Mycetocola sp. BIGb0189]MCS4275858.1 response regulator of citrate/malate metabolism [Mycetocola sp. BIGb0189]
MTEPENIRVLIVDDDPLIVELHRSFVERVPGFVVVAEAVGAYQAVAILRDDAHPIDLILLDITMPDGSGLHVLRHIRARGTDTHAIVISGVREAESVRRTLALGVAQYLIKPFTFATFYERMAQFRDFHSRDLCASGQSTQQEVDSLFSALRPPTRVAPAKGIAPDTLQLVTDALRTHGACSAAEIAEEVGMSRVVARRYLEYLTASGSVERTPRLGTPGRPQSEYRWRSAMSAE